MIQNHILYSMILDFIYAGRPYSIDKYFVTVYGLSCTETTTT